jgi:MipA family protein
LFSLKFVFMPVTETSSRFTADSNAAGGSLNKFATSAACAALFGLIVGPASAADLPVPSPTPPPIFSPAPSSPLIVSIGLGAEAATSFPGAKTYSPFPVGYLDWRKPGEPENFHAPDDGIGVTVIDWGAFKAGPVARYIDSRGLSNGNGNFRGLPNVGWTAELGGFFEFWPTSWLRSRFELRQGVTGSRGLEGNIAIDAVGHYGAWTVSVGPRANFGDDQFMKAYFSITPAQASANGLVTPYNATGGLTSLGAFGTLKYQFTPSWSLTGFVGYNRLTDSAAASPVSNRLGSRDEYTAGAMAEYTFSFSGLGLGFLGL